jgi:hypothetical protein
MHANSAANGLQWTACAGLSEMSADEFGKTLSSKKDQCRMLAHCLPGDLRRSDPDDHPAIDANGWKVNTVAAPAAGAKLAS